MARCLQFLAFAGILVFLRGQFLGQSLSVQAETQHSASVDLLPFSGSVPICEKALPVGNNDSYAAWIGLPAGESQEFSGFDSLIAIPQFKDNYAAVPSLGSSFYHLFSSIDPSLVSQHVRLQI